MSGQGRKRQTLSKVVHTDRYLQSTASLVVSSRSTHGCLIMIIWKHKDELIDEACDIWK